MYGMLVSRESGQEKVMRMVHEINYPVTRGSLVILAQHY